MTMMPLPDTMSLLQTAGGLCLIALIARRRVTKPQDMGDALSRLSGRVRDEELG